MKPSLIALEPYEALAVTLVALLRTGADRHCLDAAHEVAERFKQQSPWRWEYICEQILLGNLVLTPDGDDLGLVKEGDGKR